MDSREVVFVKHFIATFLEGKGALRSLVTPFWDRGALKIGACSLERGLISKERSNESNHSIKFFFFFFVFFDLRNDLYAQRKRDD